MRKLENKIAVVTGGAMGNGLGIVKVFLKYGAKVIILDYAKELENVVNELNKEGEVTGYNVDIRNLNDVSNAIKSVIQEYGNIDILVNNAGVCRLEKFEDMNDELRDFHFDINIKGTWNVTKECLPYMKNRKASIINLSSVTGPMVADSGEVAYATTKAAVLGFTKALAAELVNDDIRVNAIMPGYIRTPMVDGMAKETNAENPESVVDGIAAGIPMKRLGTIEELGELAAFLASNESSYIKAQGIVSEINTQRNYIRLRVGEEYKYYNFKFEEKINKEILSTNTLFLVKENGKYGYENKNGERVVDCIYDDAKEQNEFGYCAVKKDGKWGTLKSDGTVVVNPTRNLEEYLYIDFIAEWNRYNDLRLNVYTK